MSDEPCDYDKPACVARVQKIKADAARVAQYQAEFDAAQKTKEEEEEARRAEEKNAQEGSSDIQDTKME